MKTEYQNDHLEFMAYCYDLKIMHEWLRAAFADGAAITSEGLAGHRKRWESGAHAASIRLDVKLRMLLFSMLLALPGGDAAVARVAEEWGYTPEWRVVEGCE